MKVYDLEKIETAIKYVERIADGCNPVNNKPMVNNEIVNDPNVIRCMYFIKDILEDVRYNKGIVGGKRAKEPLIEFPIEVLDEFTYREDLSITSVLRQIYEPVAEKNVKKIPVTKVTNTLREEGYLFDELNPTTGKKRKLPTEKGRELGLYIIEREYNGQKYEAVFYNREAQEYVVILLRDLAK